MQYYLTYTYFVRFTIFSFIYLQFYIYKCSKEEIQLLTKCIKHFKEFLNQNNFQYTS